ncbi:MAG: SCO family protein [Stellaceae bacterium]
MSRGFLPLLVFVIAVGVAALAGATDGFRTVTSEGARELAIERAPSPLPDVRLADQNGNAFSLADYRGKPVLVEFIYTRCPMLCGVLGDDFRQVLALRSHWGANQNFALLSISFDPEHDDRTALQQYAERFGAASPGWRIAVPVDRDDLTALLHAFGVVVIPDGNGGFAHNGAIYLVDRTGHLARILDPDASPWLLAAVLREAS